MPYHAKPLAFINADLGLFFVDFSFSIWLGSTNLLT
jgi:hypothetical protein